MRYWNHDHMDSGWGILMVLTVLALWALVAVLMVFVIRAGRTPTTGATSSAHGVPPAPANPEQILPEQILAERLARGEIDPDEYRTRLDALRSAGT